jgi:hypothetical protein
MLFPGEELEGLFAINVTLELVLARIEPRITPVRRSLLARSLDGAMTPEDETSRDGLALRAVGWETVGGWVAEVEA